MIETMAESIADALLAEFGVRRVRVTVKKPGALPNAKQVELSIGRIRERAAEGAPR